LSALGGLKTALFVGTRLRDPLISKTPAAEANS
jgi:hypothetical protein